MVQYSSCRNFTRKTHCCSFFKKTIALADIHKQISCDGYPNFARRKWLLGLAHKEQNSQVKAYQILGETKE
jgi:hypothetical protein